MYGKFGKMWTCSLRYVSGQRQTYRHADHNTLNPYCGRRSHSFVFFVVHETHRIFLSPFISKASRRVSSFFLWVSSFHSRTLLHMQATLALSLLVSSLKSVCCGVSIFFAVMSRSPSPCLTWYEILSYTHHPTECFVDFKIETVNRRSLSTCTIRIAQLMTSEGCIRIRPVTSAHWSLFTPTAVSQHKGNMR